MPIIRKYETRAQLSGGVAALAGRGVFRQKADSFNRDVDEFDATLAERQRQFNANQQMQSQRLNQDQFNRQQTRMDNLFNRDQSQALAQDQRQQAIQQNDIKNLDAIANKTLGEISKKNLDDQGNEQGNKFRRDLNAIQRRKNTMTPKTYQNVLNQWADKVQTSGILDGEYDKPDVTAQEEHGGISYRDGDGVTWTKSPSGEWKGKDPVKTTDSGSLSGKDQAASDNNSRKQAEVERAANASEARQKKQDEIELANKIISDFEANRAEGNTDKAPTFEQALRTAIDRSITHDKVSKELRGENKKPGGYGFPRPDIGSLNTDINSPGKIKEAPIGSLFQIGHDLFVKVSDTEILPYGEFPKE